MPQFLDTTEPDFEARFSALLGAKREADPDVDDAVAAIIADVAAHGDAAVLALTERWDRLALTPDTLAFSQAEIDAAVGAVSPDDRDALELAADAHPRLPRAPEARGRALDRSSRRGTRMAVDRRSPRSGSTSPAGSPPTLRRC